MDHAENILKPIKGLIPLFSKVFAMFQFSLFDDKGDEEEKYVEIIAPRCINCLKRYVYI